MAGPLIEIKLDEVKLRNAQRMLRGIPNALPRAMKNAINKTVAPIRTSMARQLAAPVNAEVTAIRAAQKKAGRKTPALRFKMATIKKNIRFQKATNKVWKAIIWIKRWKGQEAKEASGTAFVQEMPKSGHISIFRRLGAAQLPIADQVRRLMRQFFMGISSGLKRETQERLDRNVANQVMFELSRWKTMAGKTG